MHREFLITCTNCVVQVQDALHKGGRKDPNAAEVEQIEGTIRRHGVVAEMGIAVEHAKLEEGYVSGSEKLRCDRRTQIGRGRHEVGNRPAFEPCHREEPARAQLLDWLGDLDAGLLRQLGDIRSGQGARHRRKKLCNLHDGSVKAAQ